MQINTYRVGDHVMITAKDDFYAYCDGWRGRVGAFDGIPAGYVPVECSEEGLTKRIVVPADEVVMMVGR